MSSLFASPGATAFAIVVLVLTCLQLTFAAVLIVNFAGLHRRRKEILESFNSPFLIVRTMRYRAFLSLYLMLTAGLTVISSILFFSLLRFL